jgi:thiol-disulfide isomerase/thioredoxin
MTIKRCYRAASILLLSAAMGCGAADLPPRNGVPALVDSGADQIMARVAVATNWVTMLHFWATWCPPCVWEFPHVARLGRDYRGKGLDVVLVSMDRAEHREAVKEFLAQYEVDWTSYLGSNITSRFIGTISTNWSGAIPTSFFYGPRGVLLESWEGARPYEAHKAAIEKLLARDNRQQPAETLRGK